MGMLLPNGSSEFGVRRELFANNEQGLWLDPSDMTAGKAGWRRNLLVAPLSRSSLQVVRAAQRLSLLFASTCRRF